MARPKERAFQGVGFCDAREVLIACESSPDAESRGRVANPFLVPGLLSFPMGTRSRPQNQTQSDRALPIVQVGS